MAYQGDIAEDQAFSFKFSTRIFTTGIPGTLGGSPILSVYKDANVTQTTTGPTLTADFDSITGMNHVAMVTTDAFYVTGSDYTVMISTGTVSSVSVVGEVVATFSIENRGVMFDARPLPGQGAPTNTPTVEEAIMWLYKSFRNRKDQTATLWQLYADDESTVDSKATVSDDATTAIKQEIVSGP